MIIAKQKSTLVANKDAQVKQGGTKRISRKITSAALSDAKLNFSSMGVLPITKESEGN
jgi:hypothetical protein